MSRRKSAANATSTASWVLLSDESEDMWHPQGHQQSTYQAEQAGPPEVAERRAHVDGPGRGVPPRRAPPRSTGEPEATFTEPSEVSPLRSGPPELTHKKAAGAAVADDPRDSSRTATVGASG